MPWSWKLVRVAGIDVRVHATFALPLVWVAVQGYREQGGGAAAAAVMFTLAFFASVVLHEYGHALTARRFGVATRDITLLPIGGVARLDRIPTEPRQELLIAIAGPAVTAAIVLACYLWVVLSGGQVPTAYAIGDESTPFAGQLMWANVTLALFNLLPAFPMDGGRVLRACLAMRTDYARATAIAARVGKGFALLFGLGGLFVFENPFLVFIALFVWMGAASEAGAAQLRARSAGVPVARVMTTDLRTLSPTDALSRGLEHVLAGFSDDLPVVDDRGRVVGMLTRAAMIRALGERGPSTPVAEVMERHFQTANPAEPIDEAFARLRDCRCRSLPVVRGDALVGLVTMERVGEFLLGRREMGRADDGAPDKAVSAGRR